MLARAVTSSFRRVSPTHQENLAMSEGTVLITGATGRTGGAAIENLLRMGQSVRAYLRRDEESAAALRARGVETAIGDFTSLDTIRAAMQDVRTAYFLHPISPGILPASNYFAQAAKEAGLEAIVNMSQISARRSATSHAAQDHWMSERVFDWSGVPTTHLRPTFFADWLVYPHFAKEIWATKRIEFPFGQGRHAPISSEDLGRVIAHVLADPKGHGGKTYSLHGPVELDHHQIAEKMSIVLGSALEYRPVEIAEFRRRMEKIYKFEPFLVQHLCEVARDYQDGIFAGTNGNVEHLTAEPPLTVEQAVELHRDVYPNR